VESGAPANSGLTIGKLRQAQYILDTAEVDEEDTRTCFFSAKQRQDLLRTTEVTSSDYATVKALVEGRVDSFMGFKFKRVNKDFLPYVAGTDVRTVVITTKQGMMFADCGKRSSMAIRYDLSEALQIRSACAIGATRMEEDRVITIACDESP
jgi:hypothetical protein